MASGDGTVTRSRISDGKNLESFSVGQGAIAAAFDGTNIWVTSYSNYVTKLRASDGTVVGTYPVGEGCFGITFDGSNIWVVNRGSSSLTKLRASDGKNLGTFAAPGAPYAVAFDGSNVRVTGTPYLLEFRGSDGAMLAQFTLADSAGVAYDGKNVWVARTESESVVKF